MTFSRLERIDVRHMTTNQPFGAGVILFQHGQLVVTLKTEGLPSSLQKEQAYRLRSVGGNQKVGESIEECALRIAREDLCMEVELCSSPRLYFHDVDSGEVYPVDCADMPVPFLVERQSNLYPYPAARPGLPTGPYSYFSLFLAQAQEPAVQPGDGVEGLLLLSLDLCPLLHQQLTLGALLEHGAEVVERKPLPRESQLWMHPGGSLALVMRLLQQQPTR